MKVCEVSDYEVYEGTYKLLILTTTQICTKKKQINIYTIIVFYPKVETKLIKKTEYLKIEHNTQETENRGEIIYIFF